VSEQVVVPQGFQLSYATLKAGESVSLPKLLIPSNIPMSYVEGILNENTNIYQPQDINSNVIPYLVN